MAETENEKPGGGREEVTGCASSRPMDDTSTDVSAEPLRRQWRDLLAYWMLGLCNNYGYVVMLSAAHDILSNEYNQKLADDGSTTVTHSANSSIRDCNTMSTGAILLADILPALAVKILVPFLVCSIHLRVALSVVLSAAGFLLVAFSTTDWVAVAGVACTSLSSGLGETSFLSYATYFHRNVVSTWSSGTGGAGIFGAGSYAGLTALGVKPADALLLMLAIPIIMALSFWVLLQHPSRTNINEKNENQEQVSQACDFAAPKQSDSGEQEKSQAKNLKAKLLDIPPLLKYMLPLTAVYLFEYFINQGLFELIQFELTWMPHKEQYRWLQLIYQIGVFISRSSVNLVKFRNLWIMALLQFINVILFLFQVIYEFIPSIWIVFAVVLWEGLLGGGAYVNTFYRISVEVPKEKREFSMGITTLSDSAGISLAGFIAMPVHNILCKLPRI